MKPDGGLVDLQGTPPDHNYKFSFEPRETTADRNVRLFKDVVVFLLESGLCS